MNDQDLEREISAIVTTGGTASQRQLLFRLGRKRFKDSIFDIRSAIGIMNFAAPDDWKIGSSHLLDVLLEEFDKKSSELLRTESDKLKSAAARKRWDKP